MRSCIREKKIYCGEQYMEVDIYSHTRIPMRGKRSKKEKVSPPKQKNLNDKNAKRYFVQRINANFGEGDLHVTATYETLPENIEEAEKEIGKYLRRVAYRRKKAGLDPLKYILVTEYRTEKESEKPVRMHHHIIMNGGLERDEIEDLWRKPKVKGQKKGELIGFINADRLKPNDYGLEAIARYLMKNPNGKKRWSSSQNLKRPEYRTNDHKYSRRQVEKIVKDGIDNIAYWKKQYPDWDLTDSKAVYNDVTGWAVYLKLRRARE